MIDMPTANYKSDFRSESC